MASKRTMKKGYLIVKPKRPVQWYDRVTPYLTVPNILITLGLIVTIIIAQNIQKAKFERSKAATEQATISILPATATITSQTTDLQIWVSGTTGFAHVTVTFDPQKIQLTKDPTLVATTLSRSIQSTSMATANATGKVIFTVGMDPTKISSYPTGMYHFATLTVKSVTGLSDQQASVQVLTAESQIVNTTAVAYSLSSAGSTITINPTQPTATSAPVSGTPVPPTQTPIPTSTPVYAPTATPTPSTGDDQSAPVITISRPKNGDTFRTSLYVSARASDPESKITAIKIFFDAKLYRTCTNVTMCTAWLNTWRVSKGTHSIVVTGTNQAGLTNSKAIIITKK